MTTEPDSINTAIGKITVRGQFKSLIDAQNCAAQLFMCTIVAYCVTPDGKTQYLRPAESRDSLIVEYWVIAIPLKVE